MTTVQTDQYGRTIQALKLKNGGAQKVNLTGASARNTTAFESKTKVIMISSDVPFYFKLGDVTVTATSDDHYMPGGIYYAIALGDAKNKHATHIAAIQASDAGTLYISETE